MLAKMVLVLAGLPMMYCDRNGAFFMSNRGKVVLRDLPDGSGTGTFCKLEDGETCFADWLCDSYNCTQQVCQPESPSLGLL